MFVEKLNKKQEGFYVIEEEKAIQDGKWEGYLEHDNVNRESIVIYTGPNFTGTKVDNFFISTPSETPWKTYLKVFSESEKIYITYESKGDQVEAEDINLVQESILDTRTELEQYKVTNDNIVGNLDTRLVTVENGKAEKTYVDTELMKKADKSNTYTKAETDSRIQAIIGAAPEALDTLAEIAEALNNDPDFAATVTNLLSQKVDKVAGKGLSTEDYTTAEKQKLAGIEEGANKYIHPSTHLASIIVETSEKRFVSDAEKAQWNDAASKGHTHSNKSILDIITQTLINAWNSAVDHISDGASHSKTARFVVGTSTAGWTLEDCDYLCDGTNDQEEIIQALNDLPATGGEIVILDGTYNITASINIPKDNVSIRGSGNATTLKRMYNSTNTDSGPTARGLITLNEKSGCKIQGLQIDGNKAAYTASDNYGIYLYSSNDNTVTGNTCNNSNNGIRFDSSSNENIVTGNTCNNNSNGIRLSLSNDNTVTGNICNNSSNGIYLSSSSNNMVTGNTCNSNYYGIFLYSSSDNTVTGNTCNNSNNGIRLYSSSSNNTITGNTCNNNSNGIYLYSSSDNTVTGNTCIRGIGTPEDYTTNQYTILLSGTGNNYNLISSNNCMGKAPVVEGGTGNTVFNNKWNESSDFEDLRADVVVHKADAVKHITSAERTRWNNKAEVSQIPTKVSQLENDRRYVTQEELGDAGYGNMLKSIYDTDNDGKVDAAEAADSVPWTGVTGKPSTFPPSSHTHIISNITGLQVALDGKMSVGPLTWNDLKGV